MRRNELFTTTAIADINESSAIKETAEITVKVHVPDNISENIKQQKINRLYDILKPKKKTAA